ncbi:AGE family epimerase/isomerase [Cupriavidus sp.]|uniref:AGE family epimerase/isomerase n=1 Tax=Cupriavidus sp. TaxID=1873897 RepID=UPI0025C44DE4|nr:AGE family epimerase/isomerase [Cupriavidus sp.]MCA3188959.1 AGE family epimerase/isomerase [Cupriavidus sp.]MCA3198678.1 AGE family epimerase/isomerase [Cupriavidus sp.]MCA3201424.1 AGE family epimerase/isomerase [Cupriavidus sp.]MCA3208676.1 AGE family epimerase/isomerase [Cupriavidus sp.]MCA3234157.1 AGE family epimerase/isomerase [Cupriavidus sp.]
MPVSTPLTATLADRIAALLAHFDTAVLPAWTGAGWNASMALAHEALDGVSGQPLPDKRYRAMACARQLYVFATMGNLPHAATLFNSLIRHFGDGAGGWIYSIDAQGAPLDTTRDLYTHAFVVFACAHYYRASGDAAALETMRRTIDVIEARFADGNGLYHAALAQNFGPNESGVQQNPIMHLTEAYLSVLEVAGEPWLAQRLKTLVDAVHARFVDPADGCVAELPQGTVGNRIEPGHQFEWYSLVMTAPALFADGPLAASLPRAFAFARRHGVADGTLGVCAALDGQGAALDATERIWAQTEFARALMVKASVDNDTAALAELEAWIEQFRQRFLHAGGWHECLAPDGAVVRAEMPSTTPYHLLTSWQALRSLLPAG